MRETKEETGLQIIEADLHLFACVSEKNYENAGHWLMFLFNCKKELSYLPIDGDEGEFEFFPRSLIESMVIPPSDQNLIWPLFDNYSESGFAVVRTDCTDPNNLEIKVEESGDWALRKPRQ